MYSLLQSCPFHTKDAKRGPLIQAGLALRGSCWRCWGRRLSQEATWCLRGHELRTHQRFATPPAPPPHTHTHLISCEPPHPGQTAMASTVVTAGQRWASLRCTRQAGKLRPRKEKVEPSHRKKRPVMHKEAQFRLLLS